MGDGDMAPKKTWLKVSQGGCDENQQTGPVKKDKETEEKCRDYCFEHQLETYFTLTRESDGTMSCKCFKDCDKEHRGSEDNVISYEVLSIHVAEDFQQERQVLTDYRLRFGKSLEKSSFLEHTMSKMNYDYEDTKKKLKDMTAHKKCLNRDSTLLNNTKMINWRKLKKANFLNWLKKRSQTQFMR